MLLPKLKISEDQELPVSYCNGDKCGECKIYERNGGRCGGCTQAHREIEASNFRSCYRACHQCTGYKVQYTAICCRSPLRDMYLRSLCRGEDPNTPKFQFTTRPNIKLKQKAIFYVSSGGVNTITAGGHQLVGEDHELVLVNITRVWGGNGFYSADLKDYLHLSPKTKLGLLTMSLDDLLERAWEKELYADPLAYQRVGLDYWMPINFSTYADESKMHQWYQFLKSLWTVEASQSWWISGDYTIQGFKMDDWKLKAVEAVPQVIFNMQFETRDDLLQRSLIGIKRWHEFAPKKVAFWFVGVSTPTAVYNLRRVCGTRDLYFVSPKPLYLASKGQRLRVGGGCTKSDLGKLELVQENYRIFAQVVDQYGR